MARCGLANRFADWPRRATLLVGLGRRVWFLALRCAGDACETGYGLADPKPLLSRAVREGRVLLRAVVWNLVQQNRLRLLVLFFACSVVARWQ